MDVNFAFMLWGQILLHFTPRKMPESFSDAFPVAELNGCESISLILCF